MKKDFHLIFLNYPYNALVSLMRNKSIHVQLRFLLFVIEEEAGEISFDENDDFVEQNESVSDAISVSEDCLNDENDEIFVFIVFDIE